MWSLFLANQKKGPPNIDKTMVILILTHELLSPSFKQAILELNVFDERFLKSNLP